MFKRLSSFLFGSAGSTARKSAATIADAQKALVAAILELRAVVDSGSAEQIASAIDVFKAKAAVGDLEPRELADEVAKAEHMLTVLAYTDRLNRGEGMQAMAVMPDGEPAYFRATRVSRETARDDDYGKLDIGEKGDLFRWRKGSAPPAVTPPDGRSLSAFDIGSAAGACNFNIVGESHYQGRLRNVCATGRSFTVMLMPEPTNAVDPNAIRVVADGADTIGYLSKEDAVYYAPVFALLGQHNRMGTCRAQLTGGAGEKRSFGVLLNLRDVDELLILIRDTLAPGTSVATDVQPYLAKPLK